LRKDLARCPVCKTPMVSKGSFGYDQRYPGGVDVYWLECPNCNHIIND
jgi:C4-type Zn-finger protein